MPTEAQDTPMPEPEKTPGNPEPSPNEQKPLPAADKAHSSVAAEDRESTPVAPASSDATGSEDTPASPDAAGSGDTPAPVDETAAAAPKTDPQAEPPTVEKPAEEKKPALAKPAVSGKPAVSEKPAVSTKPAASPSGTAKTTSAKPAAAKPTTTTKTTPAAKPASAKPAAAVVKTPPAKKASAGDHLRALVLFVLELFLPTVLAWAAMAFLFSYFNFWVNDRNSMLLLFALSVTAIALLLSIVGDTLLSPVYRRQRKIGVKFSTRPMTRLIKLAVGGLILPIAVYAVANWAPLPTPGAAMNALITVTKPVVRLAPSDAVGTVALESSNPETRVLSIRVLQAFKSPEGLNQLITLISTDGKALNDGNVSAALSTAIASYGSLAKDPLLTIFQKIDPTVKVDAAAASSGVYDRYFADTFERLNDELEQSPADATALDTQKTQLQTAQSQLQQSLSDFQIAGQDDSDPRLDFILRTFLAMNVKNDADLLAFGKRIAADTRYSSLVRGDALQLVGKYGSLSDQDFLFSYLKEEDESMQAAALRAVLALQNKVNNVAVPTPTSTPIP